jgi:hypothetical protein
VIGKRAASSTPASASIAEARSSPPARPGRRRPTRDLVSTDSTERDPRKTTIARCAALTAAPLNRLDVAARISLAGPPLAPRAACRWLTPSRMGALPASGKHQPAYLLEVPVTGEHCKLSLDGDRGNPQSFVGIGVPRLRRSAQMSA